MADANTGPRAADEQARAVIDRDARRVRLLTWLTIAGWLLALVAVGWMLWGFYAALFPRTEVLYRETPGASGRPGDPPPRDGASAEERIVGPLATHVYVLTYGLAILTGVVGLLTLVAVSTLILVYLSRRVTLRQINLSLQSISDQLQQMQATRPPTTG